MNISDNTYSSIPVDIGLKIASSLEVPDISSLSCCSRIWREICDSDCLWKPLFKAKWPLLYRIVVAKDPNFKGSWRTIYMKQHKEIIKLITSMCPNIGPRHCERICRSYRP